MKKLINRTAILILAVFLASACSSDPILFEKSDSFVAFNSETVKGVETAAIRFPVMVGTLKGSPALTVNFEVVEETAGSSVAIEGTDFTLAAATLDFPDGYGVGYLVVNPVDNDIFTGNKTFKIQITTNTEDYKLGTNSVATITIIDNEHPLGKWIGNYDVVASSYGSPGAWDENWSNVSTAADPDDVNNLIVSGLAGGDKSVVATLDLVAMTITIKPGVNIGNSYGYGDVLLYSGLEDLSDVNKDSPMVGTISEDGTIIIDHVSPVLTGANAGYIWDTFNTTWTKQ